MFLCVCEYKGDAFLKTGLHHEGIFRVPGSQTEVNHIRDAFERGTVVFKLTNTGVLTDICCKKYTFANQHMRMISEGSYDTEDWNKGC